MARTSTPQSSRDPMAAPDKIPGSLTVNGVERQLEHFLRLGQPAHIRIARRQNPIGREKTRQLLQ
jgi:hypothetical protein